ncbi:MAG: 4Fe-4S dicluster domain-containing protein [Chloroflexota bacterium]|nr:MAG: 4Fe-4S dicluster domain-containing protein [Chloroflexota bacterium]
MLKTLIERLRNGRATVDFPKRPIVMPPHARGIPVLDPVLCRGHGACADACPTPALSYATDGESWQWRLDLAACVMCGLCAETCPTGAITIASDDDLATRNRFDLVRQTIFRADGDAAFEVDELATRFRERVAATLRRSLHIRHVDAGSDNGADWEMSTLLGPVYDVQRLGIDFVASPRHADLLLVTGAVTRNLAPALWHTYDATPEPRIVVALGTDACGGGVTAGSYATAGGVDRCIPVDVYIPGDPPRPWAIINGLLLALDRREAAVRRSATSVRPGGPRARRP